MLLAIDIGNTNITCGLFKNDRIIRRFDIPTKGYSLYKMKKQLRQAKITGVVICGVVPDKLRQIEKDLKLWSGKAPYIIGKNIRVPIRNLYRNPKQVGQDRLVNAYAACAFFGAPLIAVDFGTAVTFDVISKNKEYLGGMILPGLGISADALAESTALLPKVKLRSPKELIGRDTENSILSGIVFGFTALTKGLVQQIKKKIGLGAKVIGTGGNIGLIGRHCKCLDRIDQDLTLKGLNLIYRKTAGIREGINLQGRR